MKVLCATLGLILHPVAVCNAKLNQPLKLSADFPSVELANDLAKLSSVVYEDVSCAEIEDLPAGVTCQNTTMIDGNEAMFFTSDVYDYITVAIAGTDSWEDLMVNVQKSTVPFGPKDDPYNPNAYVHKGFNENLFDNGFYDWILDSVQSLVEQFPGYDILTTGHSLGAAQATMAATALALDLGPDTTVRSINYASPRCGLDVWMDWVNGIPNLGIWRHVYKTDIVARLPMTKFSHVGHTIQLNARGASCYYFHTGDEELGYVGVPFNWQISGTTNIFINSLHHLKANYIEYIGESSVDNPDQYYVDSFVEEYE